MAEQLKNFKKESSAMMYRLGVTEFIKGEKALMQQLLTAKRRVKIHQTDIEQGTS